MTCLTAERMILKHMASHAHTPSIKFHGLDNPPSVDSNTTLASAPSTVNLHVISTPSAIALHIRLARCDYGRSSSGGGKGG
jgi:hypothetical protein